MKCDTTQRTTYTTLEPIKIVAPVIKLSKKAIKWLAALADLHSHEVGCFGFVDELGDNTYLIRDIFYPKHSEAAGATCEISPEGEALMADWLIAHNREGDIGKARFWGHSHVNMGVFASGQDEDQSVERMNRNQAYLIRGIFNKDGLLSISFYDYVNKRRFDNIKWETDEDEEDKTIRAKITELKAVNLPAVKTTYPSTGGYNDGYDEYDYSQRNYGVAPYDKRAGAEVFPGNFGGNSNFQKNHKKNNKKKNKYAYSYTFD